MTWVVKLEEVQNGKVVSRRKIGTIDRPNVINNSGDIGLRVADAKNVLSTLQQRIVSSQFKRDANARSTCQCCGNRRTIKDHRNRVFDTLYGSVKISAPRLFCQSCNKCEWVRLARSTPEFDAIRAELASQLPFRVVKKTLETLLPVDGGVSHTTIRNRTAHVAEILNKRDRSPADVGIPNRRLTLGLDSAFVRATAPNTRHHCVLVGSVEHGSDRRVFSCIQRHTSETVLAIKHRLESMGYNPQTELTVLTDGDKGLSNLARQAVNAPIKPILDWFHIAMRLQQMKQTARGLSTRVLTHQQAKQTIQQELEHLHWRLWHGRVDAVQQSLNTLSDSIRRFRRYQKPNPKLRTNYRILWAMLLELKRYVRNNHTVITNYHRRKKEGLRVSTSWIESTVNSLVNRRMNKRQQMRWTESGASSVLRVRAAVANGELQQLYNRELPAMPMNFQSLKIAA